MKDPNLTAHHHACERFQGQACPPRRAFTRPLRLVLALALVSGVWLLRQPLRDKIRESVTLANDSPPADVVKEMIAQAENPGVALLAAWASGKIVHREVALSSIRQLVPGNEPLPHNFEPLVLAGALDPDVNVREIALGILRDRKDPALAALAALQLKDPDEQVRLLGLDHLRSAPGSVGVPIVAPMLNDPDIAVLGMSLKLLENWSGQKFGAKLADSVQVENMTTGLQEFQQQGVAKTREAAEKAKAWWAEHQTEFPPVKLEVPAQAYAAKWPVPAADFQLSSLDGQIVRLSELRGKVVLLNFWTTWCPSCVGEMPVLVALKAKYGEKLAILGVSLDFVPDEHGHIGGHPSVEEQSKGVGEDDDKEAGRTSRKRVRGKVLRTAMARHVNYPILLDEKNEIGGRYNGGELPTTVIVDAQGNVRRRFIGARNMAVFEAMLDEASRPPALGDLPPKPN